MDSLVSGETLKNLKGTKTEQNLKNAFAGESQARNKYTFYAEVAKDEGYEQIAAFFTETAGNEKEHAEMWYKLLHDGGLGTTKDNLKIAVFGETGESEDMYPDYAKIAKEEGLPEIAALFEGVAKIENGHSIRYSKLLNNLENNQVFEKKIPSFGNAEIVDIVKLVKKLQITAQSVGIQKAISKCHAIIIDNKKDLLKGKSFIILLNLQLVE